MRYCCGGGCCRYSLARPAMGYGVVNMVQPDRRMLTVDDAADYCGLSVGSFKAYVRIPPVNFGRSVRYDRKDLDAFLDGFRQSPAPQNRILELAGNGGRKAHGR